MQSTSALYNSILASDQYWFERVIVIDGVGGFGESQISQLSTSHQMFHGTPSVGSAIAGEIDVSISNPAVYIPRMACIRPYVRAWGNASISSAVTITGENLSSEYASYSGENITFSEESDASVDSESIIFPVTSTEYTVSEWIPQGVFFIDTREVTANENGIDVLKIHGYDAMLKAEQEYSSDDAVSDNYDVTYVQAIAAAMGVEVDSRTWDIMGTGYVIPFPIGYSMREILGYIAASYVGSFVVTEEGKLRLVSLTELPAETNLLVDFVGDVITFGGDAILI